jgi:hypothetical protein
MKVPQPRQLDMRTSRDITAENSRLRGLRTGNIFRQNYTSWQTRWELHGRPILMLYSTQILGFLRPHLRLRGRLETFVNVLLKYILTVEAILARR